MHHSEDTIFADDLITSSFIKDAIVTTSRKISAKINEMLISFDKYSLHYFYLRSEKYFANVSGKSSSADRTSASTLQISNILVKSLPFDYSK